MDGHDDTGRPREDLRDGVREALLAALRDDAERSGAPAARRLVAAGAAGTLGAIGALLLLAGHPYGHHPSRHHVAFSCLWAGLLVVSFAMCWLRMRTPLWPLADAARTALLALGLAGLAALLLPDPHVLHAWASGAVGSGLAHWGGSFASSLALGVVVGLPLAAIAYGLSVPRASRRDKRLAWLSIAMITLLFLPGIALQCVGEPPGAAIGWLLGTLLGAVGGVSIVWMLRPFPLQSAASSGGS